MAITATDRGTGSHNSSVTSFNVAGGLTGTLTAGNTAALVISMDNANASGVNLTTAVGSTITDSAGNVWVVNIDAVQASTANANSELVLLTSNLTANLTSGGTLTITLTNACVAKVWAFVEFAPSAGNTVLISGFLAQAATVATGTPSITILDPVSTGGIILGMGGTEGSASGVDTWTGMTSPWSTAQHAGVGTTTTGQAVITQTAPGTAWATPSGPYAPTLTSADVRLGYAIFTEADATARAVGNASASSSSISVPLSRPLAIGSIGVLCFVADNTGTGGAVGNFPSTLTDTGGNTWTRRQNAVVNPGAVANSGSEVGIYTAPITTGLVPGNTITGTNVVAANTVRVWGVWELAPTGSGSMTYVTGGTSNAAANAASTVTTSSIASGDYVIGVTGAELAGDITADSDTTNGNWVTQLNVERGSTSTSSQAIGTQWKKVTAAGAQTYNTAFGSSIDSVTAWIEVNDSSVASTTTKVPAIPSCPSIT